MSYTTLKGLQLFCLGSTPHNNKHYTHFQPPPTIHTHIHIIIHTHIQPICNLDRLYILVANRVSNNLQCLRSSFKSLYFFKKTTSLSIYQVSVQLMLVCPSHRTYPLSQSPRRKTLHIYNTTHSLLIIYFILHIHILRHTSFGVVVSIVVVVVSTRMSQICTHTHTTTTPSL